MKKEQFYLLGIFLAAMLGGLVRYMVSTWLPAVLTFLGAPFLLTIWVFSAWFILSRAIWSIRGQVKVLF